jgi:hypothetical protein
MTDRRSANLPPFGRMFDEEATAPSRSRDYRTAVSVRACWKEIATLDYHAVQPWARVVMSAARGIAAIGVALVCGSAASATPATAEVIEFTLGAEPEVELLSYAFGPMRPVPSFTVTAPLGRSTELWFEDLTTGRDVSKASLTATAARIVLTFDFSDVIAASVIENLGSGTPTVTARFDYRTVSEHISTVPPTVPEPSTWVMMLIGAGGLAVSGHCVSRKPRPCFA